MPLHHLTGRDPVQNSFSLQFVWSLGERLENLRSELLLGLKTPSTGDFLPVYARVRHPIRGTRRERLENCGSDNLLRETSIRRCKLMSLRGLV